MIFDLHTYIALEKCTKLHQFFKHTKSLTDGRKKLKNFFGVIFDYILLLYERFLIDKNY